MWVSGCVFVLSGLSQDKLLKSVNEANSSHPYFYLNYDGLEKACGASKGRVDFVLLCRELPKYIIAMLIKLKTEERGFDQRSVHPVNCSFLLLGNLHRCYPSVLKGRSKSSESVRPTSPSYRDDVLDSVLLGAAYSTGQLRKTATAPDSESQFRLYACRVLLVSLSVLENFFSWSEQEECFNAHVEDILDYKELDSLFQAAFHGLALLVKDTNLLAWGSTSGAHQPLDQGLPKSYSLGDGLFKRAGASKWYILRICGTLSFFTRQFLCGAFLERLVREEANVVALLDFWLVVLEAVTLTADSFEALGEKIYSCENNMYALVRVFDLFQVIAEREDICFFDIAMVKPATAAILKLVVKRIMDLYRVSCCAIAERDPREKTVLPRSLVNLYESCLLRVVDGLADDSNFMGEVTEAIQEATMNIFGSPMFSEEWLSLDANGGGFSRDERELLPDMLGGCSITGAFSIDGRERFDIISAGLHGRIDLMDIVGLEKTVSLYKILLDLQNAGCERMFEVLLRGFETSKSLTLVKCKNLKALIQFVHTLPRQLLLEDEEPLVNELLLQLEAKLKLLESSCNS
ncbi:hypothetical protein HOP50_01g04830 [Chloropicon primus]|uniref:Uncharacterized protein n=1 Tax=Chloropicon primus TaxID=1764295 RepID=A0A5B8MC22_9CHLO|nr:hypothetical protein A3770_01p04950 [Chloropicon primus]UPQ97192.1 hypothetical protein HOP50_01g04830 [Chloropicon primus]|eukprot:QDZ17977.1 hypothetical protein A3770_01p04950 [Chloropicon primus]